jgi:LemA protein
MRKQLFTILGAIGILFSLSSCGYNGMVNREENVSSKWSQVQNVYQRRADLIPNLVNTVRGAADFERETLTQVIEARSRATSVNINADELTPENIERFEQAQAQLGSALSRLLVSVEQYPQLRANQNFLDLQAQLEGTENRITVERRNFNEAVQDYNSYIRRFPNNFTASMFGFDRKGYFEARPGAEEVPTVQF